MGANLQTWLANDGLITIQALIYSNIRGALCTEERQESGISSVAHYANPREGRGDRHWRSAGITPRRVLCFARPNPSPSDGRCSCMRGLVNHSGKCFGSVMTSDRVPDQACAQEWTEAVGSRALFYFQNRQYPRSRSSCQLLSDIHRFIATFCISWYIYNSPSAWCDGWSRMGGHQVHTARGRIRSKKLAGNRGERKSTLALIGASL